MIIIQEVENAIHESKDEDLVTESHVDESCMLQDENASNFDIPELPQSQSIRASFCQTMVQDPSSDSSLDGPKGVEKEIRKELFSMNVSQLQQFS